MYKGYENRNTASTLLSCVEIPSEGNGSLSPKTELVPKHLVVTACFLFVLTVFSTAMIPQKKLGSNLLCIWLICGYPSHTDTHSFIYLYEHNIKQA